MAVGIPARVIASPDKTSADAFEPYGVTRGDLPDPTAKVIESLMAEIETLRTRISDFESEADQTGSTPVTRPDDGTSATQSSDIQ
jgi:hypothetical protein